MFIVVGPGSNPYVIGLVIAVQLLPALLGRGAVPISGETLLLLGLAFYALYHLYVHRDVIRADGLAGFASTLFGPPSEAAPSVDSERYNRMLKTISGLPTEEFKPLEHIGIHELKARLRLRGVDTKGVLEKNELVQKLHDFRDYVEGDVLRLLSKCKHDFHLECLDKWALTLATSTRDPSCPLCNQSLE
ncbi:hypothetical protein SPRG_16300 [Saprolegnia parasitica CBS 223.65]|uniref:RING-type domain-containing protein n=1 Tax=Saprolegnia parasitica (strain CBS 223.65) TaxID=695850 RepID=A0A067BNJ0_SAPPC|nr:hypothetical protein SPRG_16300 [Saprolegnia parasitica CBS 223.65]KDO18310.1 hypothetical protein SPRG_16300 [Saprolegnia parasitica CBS 223.65]|eukprot:XP_012210985.1 hypothetical protein SPRG_16300 [Saprolegnia parasitica CBS 223.65]